MQQAQGAVSGAAGKRPVAVVTGASEGFGRELAQRIARDGYDLLLVARNEQRLGELAGHLQRQFAAGVEVLRVDLAAPDQQLSLAARLRRQVNLKLLVNNAACSRVGELVGVPGSALQQIVALNLGAVCTLSQAALQNDAFRQGGTLLNIGSIGGSCPLPLDATYACTKAAVDSFSRAIALEIAHNPDIDVRVQVAKLGGIKTGWNDRSMGGLKPGVTLNPMLERTKNDPQAAAEAIWSQSRCGKKTVFYDCLLARITDFFFSNFPAPGSRWIFRAYSDEIARRGGHGSASG